MSKHAPRAHCDTMQVALFSDTIGLKIFYLPGMRMRYIRDKTLARLLIVTDIF